MESLFQGNEGEGEDAVKVRENYVGPVQDIKNAQAQLCCSG